MRQNSKLTNPRTLFCLRKEDLQFHRRQKKSIQETFLSKSVTHFKNDVTLAVKALQYKPKLQPQLKAIIVFINIFLADSFIKSLLRGATYVLFMTQ